jgi:hypothetical protein
MSSEPYESRLDQVLREAGLPPADHAKIAALADQIVSVDKQVKRWDSPGLYDIEGGRRRCLSVMKAHRFVGTEKLRYRTAQWDLIGDDPVDLPAFDADDPHQASVPRIIFASNPRSVRICRGTVYASLTGVCWASLKNPLGAAIGATVMTSSRQGFLMKPSGASHIWSLKRWANICWCSWSAHSAWMI